MADPHLKSQIKFTWNEFCIYIHSQDNNQPSPKDSSRLSFFLTHKFSLPVCYPVYNYFYYVKSLKQSTHAFFNLFFNVYCKGFSQVVLVVKNLPANTGDREEGSISGSRRSPGAGHGNPLQYLCLENPMGRGVWWATVQRISQRHRGRHNWNDICKSIVCHTLY